jgi:arginyl-tRNA synthetase
MFPNLAAWVSALEASVSYKKIAPSVFPPTFPEDSWLRKGIQVCLRESFTWALSQAFPKLSAPHAIIAKSSNATFGDYQCNNAMSLSKLFKQDKSNIYPTNPKDIAARIVECLPESSKSFISSASPVPNGFINITVAPEAIVRAMVMINKYAPETTTSTVTYAGTAPAEEVTRCAISYVPPPIMDPLSVLVDFSSPNIAKEMHVGHLRSTIIGDSICRTLEYCNHTVSRVNHVGDWGTQFGMLITFLQEEYPDILTNPPNISDLTAIYKASKKRFDAEPDFKERSRLNVVQLQSGNPECRKIWLLLCEISRKEFKVIYDALGVHVEEFGESYYNPMIPPALEEIEKAGLMTLEGGMNLIFLPHFEIPLILRKSDGGYGYDSTDMAAIKHRCQTLKHDWVIYITDAGQANHFYMVFDAARKMGWAPTGGVQAPPAALANNFGNNLTQPPNNKTNIRLDHIGFGVVCGDDGKKFKTRSSETVKLIDLLNESSAQMLTSLKARKEEGKCPLEDSELEAAAKKIGFGAVKYFDLKQNPVSSYVFNYDRMLDTKGDTAVYLLFAYARVASILRKAKEEAGTDIQTVQLSADNVVFTHAAERALALEIIGFSDVIQSTIMDLMPNRLCDFLKILSTKFTDFVTNCKVLNSPEMVSRLALCEATKRAMDQVFSLLGIQALDRL